MKALLSRLWDGLAGISRRLRGVLPDVLDVHIYGGGALVVWGASGISEPVALVIAGMWLAGIGVWKVREVKG